MDKNKAYLFLAILIGISLIGYFVTILAAPGMAKEVTPAVLSIVGLALTGFVIVSRAEATDRKVEKLQSDVTKQVEEVHDKVETVRKQTNGINSRLQDANEELTHVIVEAATGAVPLTRASARLTEGA